MQADTELKQVQVDKVRQDWRLDPTRVIISAFIAGAAIMGAAWEGALVPCGNSGFIRTRQAP